MPFGTPRFVQLNSDMQNRYDLLVPETLIPNSSNLNDYITPGHYYTPNAGASQTIQNTPYTTSGFKLIVENLSSTQHVLQTLKAANGKRIFYRTATIVSGSYQWSDWESPVTNADLEFHEAAKITLGRYNSFGTTVINIDSTDGEEYQLVASDQDLKYQKKNKNSAGYNTIWSITP